MDMWKMLRNDEVVCCAIFVDVIFHSKPLRSPLMNNLMLFEFQLHLYLWRNYGKIFKCRSMYGLFSKLCTKEFSTILVVFLIWVPKSERWRKKVRDGAKKWEMTRKKWEMTQKSERRREIFLHNKFLLFRATSKDFVSFVQHTMAGQRVFC